LLTKNGFEVHTFPDVEPEPGTDTVLRGRDFALEVKPDWVIGLGGGSPTDAAKAIRVLYEYPDMQPAEINPFITLDFQKGTKLATIPTTSGSGAEVTWAIVLTDPVEKRKMGLGCPDNLADLAVVDPTLAATMPPGLTADTGFDALTHAVEGFTCTWHSDLTDGLCLGAARDILHFLPTAYAHAQGEKSDAGARARAKMHHAATCAGLGFGNAMASLAHAMGHTLGAAFQISHGRAVGLFLPYTIEFAAREAPGRFAELAAAVGMQAENDQKAARGLAEQLRKLRSQIDQPLSIQDCGLKEETFIEQLQTLVDNAANDTQMVTAARMPSFEELEQIFRYAYRGQPIDF
jgi:alcohol dehydrogenase class IV